MPTFSPIAFDRLLEPGSRNSKQPMRGRQVSPALYATPKATPLPHDSPSSPSSFSPFSPYIINHKRRGPSLSDIKNSENNDNDNDVDNNGGTELSEIVEREEEVEEREEFEEELEVENSNNLERESETDFFEFNDSMSNVSESFKPGTPNGDFFDAFEEISSEGGVTFNSNSNKGNNIEEEMREMRLSLLMEIEKRKQTEESLSSLQNQWLRLSQQLSLLNLNLPVPQFQNPNSNLEFEIDPAEELCNQIRVSRAVSEAVERGISRAELATEIEKIIQLKNFEISRLTDRVQYYEAANREMTHRNQESIEMARQERNRKKREQKWFYASIVFAVTLGSAAIVWSYLPASRSVQIDKKELD